MALPLLLQASLVLFLAGLVDLLWGINGTIAGIVTGFIALSLLLIIASALIPLFSPSCPYKSALSWIVYQLVSLVIRMTIESWKFLRTAAHGFWGRFLPFTTRPRSMPSMTSTLTSFHDDWSLRDLRELRRDPLAANAFHARALQWLHSSSLHDPILDLTVPCMDDLLKDERVRLVVAVISSALGYTPRALVKLLRKHDDTFDLLKGDKEGMQLAGQWALPRHTRQRHLGMLLDVLPHARQNDPDVARLDILFLLRFTVSVPTISHKILYERYWPAMVDALGGPYNFYSRREKLVVWSSLRRLRNWKAMIRERADGPYQTSKGSYHEAGQTKEYFELSCRTSLEALWAFRHTHSDPMRPLPERIRRPLVRLYGIMAEYLQSCQSQRAKVNCFPFFAPDVTCCHGTLLCWARENSGIVPPSLVRAVRACHEMHLLPDDYSDGHIISTELRELEQLERLQATKNILSIPVIEQDGKGLVLAIDGAEISGH
ncbi:hypothetical protein PUNSTDRAFT_45785 [Punctularia strigosozonata HHB-11173 SS5]|uniref:uncharacterized protein n=1 Tax=Punctularia strigosozonata (strain HHB-11173) TaxID=741275 RepID=UPI00044172CD|nr:uncharacterized protein PUNSTDRAFT_45785 [Punctularia strigosozonata HHB-11173 SS5]EIN07366.1 hypothetical protein PUNSTDRAFT_45785 [Punctularia strigosozonata HHB-11173 SS5]